MAIPDVAITVRDGGLGLISPSGKAHVKIGACSVGTVETVIPVADTGDVRTKLGRGPLAEAVGFALTSPTEGETAAPVYAMRCDTTGGTAAAAGSVTPARVGSSTGTLATTGSAPLDSYEVIVEIVSTGTLGAGTFRVSFDNGTTWSGAIVIPGGGTYTGFSTENGVTLVFTAGGGPTFFEAGDRFAFSTTAASYTTAKLALCIAALAASSVDFDLIHIVGVPADATATATLFDAVAAYAATLATGKRYVTLIMEAADTTDANLITAFASKVSADVGVAAGFAKIYEPVSGRYPKRSAAWPIVARIAAAPIWRSPARKASGPLAGISSLYRDERATEGLDAARFMTLRTFVREPGFFVTKGRMMAASGSDFQIIQYRRIINRGRAVGYNALLKYLEEDLRVNGATGILAGLPGAPGTILEQDAKAIDNYVTSLLQSDLSAGITSVSFQTNRTDNLLSTQLLRGIISIVPKAYASTITAEISLVNPALAPSN